MSDDEEFHFKESMKHRFKKSYPYKSLNEMHFKDDTSDIGETYGEFKRRLQGKGRSPAGGRKPAWKAKRKHQRNHKRSFV